MILEISLSGGWSILAHLIIENCVRGIIDYARRSPGKSWDLQIFFEKSWKYPGNEANTLED